MTTKILDTRLVNIKYFFEYKSVPNIIGKNDIKIKITICAVDTDDIGAKDIPVKKVMTRYKKGMSSSPEKINNHLATRWCFSI